MRHKTPPAQRLDKLYKMHANATQLRQKAEEGVEQAKKQVALAEEALAAREEALRLAQKDEDGCLQDLQQLQMQIATSLPSSTHEGALLQLMLKAEPALQSQRDVLQRALGSVFSGEEWGPSSASVVAGNPEKPTTKHTVPPANRGDEPWKDWAYEVREAQPEPRAVSSSSSWQVQAGGANA